jgi:hypothetical protein
VCNLFSTSEFQASPVEFRTRATVPYDRAGFRRLVAGKMSAFRNKIGFNMDQAKIAQELADHMVNGKNPLNINPLVNTADDIYAEYMLFMMENQPSFAAFILAPLSNYGDVFDEDDPTRCVLFSEALGLSVKEQGKAKQALEGLMKETKPDSPKKFRCENCSKTFSKKDHLEDHIAVRHTGSKVCPKCNNTFEDKHSLKEHQKQCRHKCDICVRKFYDKRNRDAHLKIHTNLI